MVEIEAAFWFFLSFAIPALFFLLGYLTSYYIFITQVRESNAEYQRGLCEGYYQASKLVPDPISDKLLERVK